MAMKISLYLLSAVSLLLSPLAQADTLPSPTDSEELIVFNRILTKVNDKTISVIDVMKRMDMFLQKHYSHLVTSKVARFQFYSSQWRDYLTQMIDQELMIADAEHLEVKVSDSDVREEVLNRFGPNIMPALDQLSISYEEAREIIRDELIMQKMMWFRVNSKALSSVNSLDVKDAYKQFCKDNPELEEWQYQVLSLRSSSKDASQALASRAFDLLQSKFELAAVSEQLNHPQEEVSITLSPEMQADEKSISASHKDVLITLAENSYSQPIAQISRVDNSVVYRIFHLIKHSKKEVPTFTKMADQIKDQLLNQAASKENIQYIAKLRNRLGYDEKYMQETLPNDFQPFAIR